MLGARESSGRNPILQPRSPPPAARSSAGRSRDRLAKPGSHCQDNGSKMAEPVYRRVVIKLSGEYLAGDQSFGIDQATVDRIAGDLIAAQKLGTEIAVVVGGGNMIRGVEVSSRRMSLPTGDTMGMLATVMNCLAPASATDRKGMPTRTLSAFVLRDLSELFTRRAATKYLA